MEYGFEYLAKCLHGIVHERKLTSEDLAREFSSRFGMSGRGCNLMFSSWMEYGPHIRGPSRQINLNRVALVLHTFGEREDSEVIAGIRQRFPDFEYPPSEDMKYTTWQGNKKESVEDLAGKL